MRLLFIHGAGGQVEDRRLADDLGAAVGVPVVMPLLSDEDMSFEAWATPVRDALAETGADDLVVGHSFGASILLRALAERRYRPTSVILLAMPDWSPDGWDVADYAYDGPEPPVSLTLHHCRDDDVVPIEHLTRHAVRLPSAVIREHPVGGHQFDRLAAAITAPHRPA